MKNENNNTGIHQTLSGQYKVSIVSGDGKTVIWEDPKWNNNLILNNGMDMVASYTYAQVFLYAIAGSGVRVNMITSGDSPSAQSGTTVTLTPGVNVTSFTQSLSGYSQLVNIGDVIAFDTANAVTVQSVSNLTCTVSPSQTVTPAQGYTIWKTSQLGLHNELLRAGSGVSDSYWVNGSSSLAGNVYSLFRTYDFRAEPGAVTYYEIGVGNSAVSSSITTFSRILLDTPITIGVGQRLRVAYQLNVGVQPTSSVYRVGATVPVVSNWPVAPVPNLNATESLQSATYLISQVNTDGTAGGFGTLEPAVYGPSCTAWISEKSQSLSSFGTATDRTPLWTSAAGTQVLTTRIAYTGAGAYYVDKIALFGISQANSSALRSISLGAYQNGPLFYSSFDNTHQGYCMLFNYSQSKSDTQTLALSWRFSWARSLSNGA